MRIAAHVVIAYLLLVVTGAIWRITPFDVIAPDITLVFAVYLGMSGRSMLAQSTAGIVIVGWLADLLGGAPRGLSSVVMGVVCILCRLASSRLLLRGRLYIATFCLIAAVGANLLILGVRAYFSGSGGGHLVGDVGDELIVIFGGALVTAALSPLLFKLCRLVDARFARTEREREAVKEGYLS
jgi:hypothetical protein